ncbi:MAG: NERD domain-containing protein [Sulfurimonas sp.]|uniref:NERD domain-containing protein n=1 Tax=Sulfurimonas sp. TaxID=2022749 RepID=UPI0025EF6E3D|nr:NERD domain-containing protein [Sulfurimonas sp.]MCK9490745.1 NERD domain-containing protein [Sulfurimonas sp.]
MIDVSSLLAPLLQVWWILPIIFIILFFKSSAGKGLLGESLVNIVLNLRLDENKYKVLKDVTVETEDGTTQIDHIIVSQYGIFVIETKNMKGWIFGDEHQKTWTQTIYKNKNKFQNPLHQNYKHVKAIESMLGIDINKIFSLVVFVGDSTFKTDMPHNVVYAGGMLKYINSKNKIVFSSIEVNRLVREIESNKLSRSIKTHREHVDHLRSKNEVRSTVKRPVYKNNMSECPRCGGELVFRVAKRGVSAGSEFYGCSSYPRCKYTKSI